MAAYVPLPVDALEGDFAPVDHWCLVAGTSTTTPRSLKILIIVSASMIGFMVIPVPQLFANIKGLEGCYRTGRRFSHDGERPEMRSFDAVHLLNFG
jgi:hypothetical protein